MLLVNSALLILRREKFTISCNVFGKFYVGSSDSCTSCTTVAELRRKDNIFSNNCFAPKRALSEPCIFVPERRRIDNHFLGNIFTLNRTSSEPCSVVAES